MGLFHYLIVSAWVVISINPFLLHLHYTLLLNTINLSVQTVEGRQYIRRGHAFLPELVKKLAPPPELVHTVIQPPSKIELTRTTSPTTFFNYLCLHAFDTEPKFLVLLQELKLAMK